MAIGSNTHQNAETLGYVIDMIEQLSMLAHSAGAKALSAQLDAAVRAQRMQSVPSMTTKSSAGLTAHRARP